MNKLPVVLDSTCFILAWKLPEFLKDHALFTTGMVSGEMRSPEAIQRFSAVSPSVKNPGKESVEEAKRISKKLKDKKLSGTDLSVLALALELNCPVVTDDYSLQNACFGAGIEPIPLSFKGISEMRKFSPGSGNKGQLGRPKDK